MAEMRAAAILDRCLAPRLFRVILVLVSAAICAWHLPYELPSPDAGAALAQASKLARGAVFYRDIDAYPFPAASYLLAAAMRLFGEHLTVARMLAAAMYTAIVLAGYGITLAAAGRGAAALCALWLLSLKFFAYPAFLDSLYPDVALCFAIWSIFVFLRFRDSGRRTTLLIAGVLAGMTVLSKQNLGIYLGAAIGGLVLLRPPVHAAGRGQTLEDEVRNDREGRGAFNVAGAATFAAGAAAPLVLAALYFYGHGVLGPMLYSGLVRPFSGYAPTSSLSYTVPLEWWHLGDLRGMPGFAYAVVPIFRMLSMEKAPLLALYPLYWLAAEVLVRLVYTAIPLLFAASALCVFRRRGSRPQADTVAGLAVLALAVFGSAFPRADFYHVASISPVLLVLAFVVGPCLIDGLRPQRAAAARLAAAATTIVVFAASLLMTAWLFRDMTYEAGNERGRMLMHPEYAWVDDVIHYLDANLDGDEPLFVYGHEAYYYFFSGHHSPFPFLQLYPGMTGDDGGKALAASIEHASPRIIVRGIIAGWPGLEPVEDYAGELKTFIEERYQPNARPFSDGLGPDAPAPPGWACTVMEQRAAPR